MVVRLGRGPDPDVRFVGLGTLDGLIWYNSSDSGRGRMTARSVDGNTFVVTGDIYAADDRGNYIGKTFELGLTCP